MATSLHGYTATSRLQGYMATSLHGYKLHGNRVPQLKCYKVTLLQVTWAMLQGYKVTQLQG